MGWLSAWRRRLTDTIGLRLAFWYAAVFVISTCTVGILGYELLATSLIRRDHELLQVKLAEYAARYESGGLMALSNAVNADQAAGEPDSVIARVVASDASVRLVMPLTVWESFGVANQHALSADSDDQGLQAVSAQGRDVTFELASRTLPDGTLIQVGRTTIGRERFLAEVRKVLGLLVIAIASAGVAGGVALTRQALRPLRSMIDTVRQIARTGQLHGRVTVGPEGDLMDELGRVFNSMLERIEMLVDGMRGALDNVAHDLRTPTARLRARAEAALASGARGEDAAGALADCIEEADRVMALLTTLLDISEAQTGTMQLTIASVPVSEVVDETIDLYEDLAEDRGVSLEAAVPADLRVDADHQRLRQVLANLVDNALKYTDRGGRVKIAADAAPDGVRIVVSDTGVGIAASDLPRIWDRLYRADQSRGEPGLGLGLSLVRAVVAAHGGTAGVTSAPGLGSTFTITLPARLQDAASPPPTTQA